MIIDAVFFMSEFRIVLYENDVNRRIVDLCFFGSSAQLPVCLLCQMIAFYNELLSLSKALSLAPENYSVLFYLGRCYSRLDLYDKALCCATDLQGKGVVRNDGVLFLCKKAIGPHQVLHSRKQLLLSG
jgi:hypothetical protein